SQPIGCALCYTHFGVLREVRCACDAVGAKLAKPRRGTADLSSPLALGSTGESMRALLQRLAAVSSRLSLCADKAADAQWWMCMHMASDSGEDRLSVT